MADATNDRLTRPGRDHPLEGPDAAVSLVLAQPDWQDTRLRRLPPAALTAWQVENALGAVVGMTVLAVLAAVLPGARVWLVVALVAAAVGSALEALVLLPRRHAVYRYGLLAGQFVLLEGTFVQRRRAFPLHHVLYVGTRQGPVLRRLGLVKVQIGTVGDPTSFGPIPPADADALRASLNKLDEPE